MNRYPVPELIQLTLLVAICPTDSRAFRWVALRARLLGSHFC